MILTHEDKFGEDEWISAGRPDKIATASTGTDHIDMKFMEKMGVTVFSLKDDPEALMEIRASSEFTFLAILLGLRRIDRVIGTIERGQPGHELYGKRVGIVGLGRIGSNIWRWCSAFDANVIYHDPYVKGYTAPLEIIFRSCNVVVVSCTLTDETRHMIGYDLFSLLPKDAVFVNTSRGAVLVEKDLERILDEREDITAVLDVLEGELDGTAFSSPLWWAKNCIITPHIAGHCIESEEKAGAIAEKLLYNRS